VRTFLGGPLNLFIKSRPYFVSTFLGGPLYLNKEFLGGPLYLFIKSC